LALTRGAAAEVCCKDGELGRMVRGDKTKTEKGTDFLIAEGMALGNGLPGLWGI